jgi:hypothetical protein
MLPLSMKKPLSGTFHVLPLHDSHRSCHSDLLILPDLGCYWIHPPRAGHRRIYPPRPWSPLDLPTPSPIVVGSALREHIAIGFALPDPLGSELLRSASLDTDGRSQVAKMVENHRSMLTPPHSNALGSLTPCGSTHASSWLGSHETIVGASTTTSSPSN